MNRVVLLFMATSITAVASARQDDNVCGTYRLRVSDDSLALAHVMGQPAPDGALILGTDHIFELVYRTVSESSHRFGRYAVDGSAIVLRFRNRSQTLEGNVKDGAVVLGGVEYRNDRWRPTVHQSESRAVFYPDPNPPRLSAPVAAAAPPPVAQLFDAIGSWSVRNHGIEDATSTMTFDRDGSFSFKGHGATSRGHYRVHDGVITLIWTQIDDDAVEEGTVKKDVPICVDGAGFDIDTYHYERCTK